MSFDVHFQRFRSGEPSPGGGDVMRALLEPYIVREEREHNFVEIAAGDRTADVYLGDDHMMANHISGVDPWDVLVRGARAAGWVIFPGDCPVCVTDDAQRADLPPGLQDDVTTVATGADLLQVIRSS